MGEGVGIAEGVRIGVGIVVGVKVGVGGGHSGGGGQVQILGNILHLYIQIKISKADIKNNIHIRLGSGGVDEVGEGVGIAEGVRIGVGIVAGVS